MTIAILVLLIFMIAGVFAVLLRFGGSKTSPPQSLAVPHRDYAGPVLDPNRVLLGRDLESVEMAIRADNRVTMKLICEDGSYVAFGLREKS